MYYLVYFLVNEKGKHYIGCTNNIKDRIKRHNSGHIAATKNDKPWRLKSCFIFDNQQAAFEFEQYLKSGSGRNFMKRHGVWE